MESWDRRVARAEALAQAEDRTPSALLTFYAHLLRTQQQLARHFAQALAAHQLTGAIEQDLPTLRAALPALLETVERHGPPPLVGAARELAQAADEAIDDLLVEQWRQPRDTAFFPKALLQAYASPLVASGWQARERAACASHHSCPRCGGPPQLSFLTTPSSAPSSSAPSTVSVPQAVDSGGGRQLLCATCLESWPARRILCPHCGEDDEHRLAYYHAPDHAALAHVRVDACETCRHYLKSVDLTRTGLAVPLVDEVAAAVLDVWARERGYTKIALNLVGL